ncbi:hypothetical protein [Nesterenkonia muleiensis]|uniref:hypothetical protein n=1 Tax=Nesterenkonia muleiensis TaxID=2282648 RepID=UPI0013002A09|nr:hypothetical protein [Nesterenkonia muleiensis]
MAVGLAAVLGQVQGDGDDLLGFFGVGFQRLQAALSLGLLLVQLGLFLLQQFQWDGVVEVGLQQFLLPAGDLLQADAQLGALFFGVLVNLAQASA